MNLSRRLARIVDFILQADDVRDDQHRYPDRRKRMHARAGILVGESGEFVFESDGHFCGAILAAGSAHQCASTLSPNSEGAK